MQPKGWTKYSLNLVYRIISKILETGSGFYTHLVNFQKLLKSFSFNPLIPGIRSGIFITEVMIFYPGIFYLHVWSQRNLARG